MFIKLNKLLDKSIKKAGLEKQVVSASILEKFSKVAEEIFGKGITEDKIRPLYLKNNTLTVACLSATMAQELKSHEQEILEKVNKENIGEKVERLRFLV